MPRLASVAVLLSAALLASCGKSESPSSSAASSSTGSGSSGDTAPGGLDSSKDNSGELKKLMEWCYTAAKDGDAKLADTIDTFMLPNHESWLKKTFGDELGTAWAKRYADMQGSFRNEVRGLFDKVVRDGQSGVTVYYLTDPEDRHATGNQKDAMNAMKEKTGLYTVKFIKPGEDAGVSVWSWAVVDGKFRLIGKRP